jgi:hypothetical protein
MSKRGGVPEKDAFGPGPGEGSVWLLTKRNGEVIRSVGPTAYKAAASVGLSLGELADVKQCREPQK